MLLKAGKAGRIASGAWLKAWRIIIIMLSTFNINDLRYDRSAWLCITQHVVPESRQNVHLDQSVRFNLDQLVRFHYSRARLRGGASLCCASLFLHLIAFYACSIYISMLSIRYQQRGNAMKYKAGQLKIGRASCKEDGETRVLGG